MRNVPMWFLVFLMLLPAAGHAQQVVTFYPVSSGSGFFVNRQYVITNAHVVRGCSEAYIKGSVSERKATVKFVDETNDLALLETDESPNQFAPLRFNIDDLKEGDKVFVIGYPGEAGARGEFVIATAQVQNKGLPAVKGHFFITDVVEHGNSGGPVFDTSGNVIGVVVAKSEFYLLNPITQQRSQDIHAASIIDLNTLKQFLFDHGVFTEWVGSSVGYQDSYIEDTIKGYIVNVQCRTPEAVVPGGPVAIDPNTGQPMQASGR